MQTVKTITEAIALSRQLDEIIVVEVADLSAAIAEAERIGAAAQESTDWADDAPRENGASVVGMWGWDADLADQDHSAWRIELVATLSAPADRIADAHWDAAMSCYAITTGGVTYRSGDGDQWIDARTGDPSAPAGDVRLVGGMRSGEVVA